jgi:asparagine synthase (glutamine-hydrolysing)
MCGLGGEFRLNGERPDLDAVARMSPCLERRGPDSKGTWTHGPVAFLHHRLKIIDLSPAGGQPMVDQDLRLAMVFNGCVYNHHELRRELQGHGYTFASVSDTEVILKAYHRWGPACVERFVGMFAFVISELDTGRLVLARDRLGIKPLYLSRTAERVRFASTLPALLAGGDVDTTIDKVALHHYLSWHSVVPAPRTILTGVQKLPPATVRVIERDGSSTDTVYWNPPATRSLTLPKDEWRERTLAALDLAVQRRMVSDVPVGVLLSGGLDSSLVVALLARAGQNGLATFSIGFNDAGGESGDEFEYSDLVAKEFGTDHHKIRIADARLAAGVDGAIGAMSEPMVSHDCVAFYLLSEEVAKHITVVQSGQGADEVFAGYDWYPPLRDVPRSDAVSAYSKVFFDRPDAGVRQILNPDWSVSGDPSLAFVRDHFAAPGAETTLDAALRIDSRIMLVDDPVKRVDNMTMAWGLEARVPFLDHELVELAALCPPELKLAHGGKGVLKEAARGVVPDAVIDRTKGYFPVPGVRHLDGEILDRVRDALGARAAVERGLFRPDMVRDLLEDPNAARTTIGANVLWQIGLLELWLQRTGL